MKQTFISLFALLLFCAGGRAQGPDAAQLKLDEEQSKVGETKASAADHAWAQEAKSAQKWYDDSVALVARGKGNFIAVVQVQMNGKQVAGFRYDRFSRDDAPVQERVMTQDSATYVREEGKEWTESAGWGKSGAPAWLEKSQDLDALVEMALRALKPAPITPAEGDVVWKPLEDGTHVFEQSRAQPQLDGGYPRFEFVDNVNEKNGTLLRTVVAPWKWHGQPAQVTVNYFYMMQETAPQAGPPLEEQVAAALREADAKPVKVDAVFRGAVSMRVAGIMAGKDFDLTVVKDGVASRQIVIGNDAWSSGDGGTTWRKLEKADRTYYDAAHFAIEKGMPETALLWPVDVSGAGIVPGSHRAVPGYVASDGGTRGGEALQRLSLKVPFQTDAPDILSYWVAVKEGKASLRRITGLAAGGLNVHGMLHADFADVAGAQGVLPPPGNPEAVPPVRPEELLAQAVKAMDGAGVWRVELRSSQQEDTGRNIWGDPKLRDRITGLVSGKDFDLAEQNPGWTGTPRRIGIKDKAWYRADDSSAWKQGGNSPAQERADYDTVRAPLGESFTGAVYEIAGTETHDGETWLHIRMEEGQGWGGEARPEYWLQLDKAGKPVAVRRCVWADVMYSISLGTSDTREYQEETFTPATENEKIEEPQGE